MTTKVGILKHERRTQVTGPPRSERKGELIVFDRGQPGRLAGLSDPLTFVHPPPVPQLPPLPPPSLVNGSNSRGPVLLNHIYTIMPSELIQAKREKFLSYLAP